MRYLVGFVSAVVLVALPMASDAQGLEETAAPEQSVEEPVPEEPALELKQIEAGPTGSRPTLKPWLVLELNPYGLKMKRTGPTVGGPDYILVATSLQEAPFSVKLTKLPLSQEELERQKKRRRRRLGLGIGIGATLGAFIVGSAIAAAVVLPWGGL